MTVNHYILVLNVSLSMIFILMEYGVTYCGCGPARSRVPAAYGAVDGPARTPVGELKTSAWTDYPVGGVHAITLTLLQ